MTTIRGVTEAIPVGGRRVILVDDGVATGATVESAVRAIADQDPDRIVIGVAGGPRETLEALAGLPGVDEVVAVAMPPVFWSVGQLYDSFDPVSIEEVCAVLQRHRLRRAAGA